MWFLESECLGLKPKHVTLGKSLTLPSVQCPDLEKGDTHFHENKPHGSKEFNLFSSFYNSPKLSTMCASQQILNVCQMH